MTLCAQEMLDEMQCGIQQYDWPDWWFFGKERRFLHAPEEASHIQHSILGSLYINLAFVTAAFKTVIEQLTVPMCGSEQSYTDDFLPAVWVLAYQQSSVMLMHSLHTDGRVTAGTMLLFAHSVIMGDAGDMHSASHSQLPKLLHQ